MNIYISIIKESFGWFPVVAFFFTIPYVIQNYHKYGSIMSVRVVIIYSLILYLMTAYFLVILPLPARETVEAMTGPRAQLIPFGFIRDILKEYAKSGVALYRNKALLQFVFNMAMLVPFGMYLHYYFRTDLKKTILYSFLLSLFFEITQLTGLYFLYPRPYRLFDVDDLIANTLGGLVGYLLVIPFFRFLPDREEMDATSIRRGQQVSALRRLTAFGIDGLLYSFVIVMCGTFVSTAIFDNLRRIFYGFFAYYAFFMIILNGRTPAMLYLKMRFTSDGRYLRLRCLLRYFITFVVLIRLPYLFLTRVASYAKDFIPYEMRFYAYGIAFGIFCLFCLYEGIMLLMGKQMLYEKISGTRFESVIRQTKDAG